VSKDTFNNLSAEKKRKIFDAAVLEFSRRRFSEASINQIVKAAGIPRGSFYQYFNGKEDLFLYMYEEILKEKQEIIRQSEAVNLDADVFEICMQTTRSSYEWGRLRPAYSHISMLMEIDDSAFITGLRTSMLKVLRDLIERDKGTGLIKPEIDSDLVVDMIYTLLLREFFWTGLDENRFLKKLGDAIQIIKEGIVCRTITSR
jgi:AcrR family transcriptional regulator